jgi:hypothetical protein
MGVTIRQKTKGKSKPWWVFVVHLGQRTSKLVGDKRAANAVASEIRTKLKKGEFGFEDEKPEEIPTFGEYADSWIKTTVHRRLVKKQPRKVMLMFSIITYYRYSKT